MTTLLLFFLAVLLRTTLALNFTRALHETKLDLPVEEARQYGSAPVKYLISSLNSQSSNPYGQTKVSYLPPPPPPLLPTTTAASYISITSNTPSISLGDACTGYTDCTTIRGATCQQNVCSCGAGTVSLGNIACIPVAKFLGDQCILTAQCKAVDPLATCYRDVCLCEPIYHVAGDAGGSGGNSYGAEAAGAGTQGQRASLRCIRKQKLGEACTDTIQCAYQVWNSVCDPRTRACGCAAGFVPIGNTQCAPIATALGQACSVNAQCMNVMFAVCGRSGTCECPDAVRYVQIQSVGSDRRKKRQAGMHGGGGGGGGYGNQMCMPAQHLGRTCMVGAQCKKKTKNSDCIGGICRCVDGFVPRDPQVNECLPKIMAIGLNSPPCTISAQCMLPGSFCNGTIDRCDCNKLFCNVGGECLPKTGHELPCKDSCQCSTIGATCLNGWCQCRDFNFFVPSINMCMPRALQFTVKTFAFTANCCGDTSRSRCIGQATIDPSSNITGPFQFSLSSAVQSPVFSIDRFGAVFLAGTPALTSAVILSVTVSVSGQTDTAQVIVKPGFCCTQSATLTGTTSTTTVNLIPTFALTAGGTILACVAAPDAGTTGPAGTSAVVTNSAPISLQSLFTQPCGELNTITGTGSVVGTPTAPTAPTVAPACVITNGFLGFTGGITQATPGTTSFLTCAYTLSATSCNGLISTLTYTVVFAC